MSSVTGEQQQPTVNNVTGPIEAGPTSAPEPTETSAASLDKVRDILFGGQMRDLDRRFVKVDERLSQETAELKEDLRRRLAALEQFARTETEALVQRIRTEHDERTEATGGLMRDLQGASAAFDRKLAQLDDEIARAQRELRHQIHEVHQRLADEMRDKMEAVLTRLEQESQDLRAAKADRAALAALFTEMAVRLSADPPTRGEQE